MAALSVDSNFSWIRGKQKLENSGTARRHGVSASTRLSRVTASGVELVWKHNTYWNLCYMVSWPTLNFLFFSFGHWFNVSKSKCRTQLNFVYLGEEEIKCSSKIRNSAISGVKFTIKHMYVFVCETHSKRN